MFLVKSRLEDGSFVSAVVEEAGQHIAKGKVPFEPVILPEIKERFRHQLGQSEDISSNYNLTDHVLLLTSDLNTQRC